MCILAVLRKVVETANAPYVKHWLTQPRHELWACAPPAKPMEDMDTPLKEYGFRWVCTRACACICVPCLGVGVGLGVESIRMLSYAGWWLVN